MKKMPLLAFISFTSNFSAPFFRKKNCPNACPARSDKSKSGI